MTDSRPDPRAGAAAPAFVEDLFLTDSFLIKGRLAHKAVRLSTAVEQHSRSFLQVEDAVMAALRGGDVIHTPRVLIRKEELIFAHELFDTAGDSVQRQLAADERELRRIRAFYSGSAQLEVAGFAESGAYEATHNAGRSYFIMRRPEVRGIDLSVNKELAVLQRLDYAIVRKDKLTYVYDFG